MAKGVEEPVGSMGTDGALAVLDDRPQLLFRYFKQQFAQVTNSSIDPIREETVMSLVSCLGPEGNLLEETGRQCCMLELPHSFPSNDDLVRLCRNVLGDFRIATLYTTFSLPQERSFDAYGDALRDALDKLCDEA